MALPLHHSATLNPLPLSSLNALPNPNPSTSFKAETKSLKDTLQKGDANLRLAERKISFLQALVASFNAEEVQMDQVMVDELKSRSIHELETPLSGYESARRSRTHHL